MYLKLLKNHIAASLFKNAYFLMSSSVLSSVIGYLYWISAARLFPPEEIGFIAAVLAAASLIMSVGDLGLGITAIRHLQSSGSNKLAMANSVITIPAVCSVLLGLVFLVLIPYLAPQYLPLVINPLYGGLFLLLAVGQSVVYSSGSIFTALLASDRTLYLVNISAVGKLVLIAPIALMFPGSHGLIIASALAIWIGISYSFIVSFPSIIPEFKFRFTASANLLVPLVKYSFSNYFARICLEAQNLLFPIISLHLMGPEKNAIFYMALITSMVLRVIPSAIFNSLFAESSNDKKSSKKNLRDALKLNFLIIIPACLAIIICSEYLLVLIGENYAKEGRNALMILVVANIPWSINYMLITLARVNQQNKLVITICVALLLSSIIPCFFFMPTWGPSGGAMAYLLGQILTMTFMFFVYGFRHYYKVKPYNE